MQFTEEDRKAVMVTLAILLGMIFLASIFTSIYAAWVSDMSTKRWFLFAGMAAMGGICLGLATECLKLAKDKDA